MSYHVRLSPDQLKAITDECPHEENIYAVDLLERPKHDAVSATFLPLHGRMALQVVVDPLGHVSSRGRVSA